MTINLVIRNDHILGENQNIDDYTAVVHRDGSVPEKLPPGGQISIAIWKGTGLRIDEASDNEINI